MLVTYPRTDSRYLTDDMAHNLPDLVNMAFHTFPDPGVDNVPVHAEQVVDNKKVTDHHAIIPTRELQKCNLNELPKGELAILQLISTRLFVAVGDPHRYAETVIELDCGGTVFSAKGKTILHNGGNSSRISVTPPHISHQTAALLSILPEVAEAAIVRLICGINGFIQQTKPPIILICLYICA